MRVLHVTDTFLPRVGGAEIAIDQLARAMAAVPGVECAVLAQRVRRHRLDGEAPYAVRRYGDPRSAAWAGWWVRRHMARLERRDGAFDVYVGHHSFPPGYACVRHGRRVGRPAIICPHGVSHFESSRFRRHPGAWKKLAWALANAAAVVCPGPAIERAVRQIIGVSAAEGRVVRIPMGVNAAELRADASGSGLAGDARLRGPFVLGLGRAIRRKGFHVLIEAFGRVAARAPDWSLVIAGEGRDLPAFRALASSLGERVIFTGTVTGADKRWLLQHCRFMAAPSLEEGFGTVALEAMACGKPVVASRAAGFAEVVRDGENGRSVEVGDAGALADALADFTGRDLSGLAAAAERTAAAYAWEIVARQYLDLLDRVRREWGGE